MLARPPPVLSFDQVGAQQLQWDGATDEVTFFAPVGQSFTCGAPGLHRVEIYIEPGFGLKRSHLWLKVFPGRAAGGPPGPAALRIVGPLHADSLRSHGWFAFEFEPLASSAGQEYTLVVEAPDAAPGNALRLRSHAQDHPGLRLTVDGRPAAGALLFRAVCLRSPQLFDNFERFRRGVRERSPVVDHRPLMARLEISRPCNLHCIMCTRGIRPFDPTTESPGFMSLETFRFLDPVLPQLLWIIAFGLGEPFLNPDYLAILRHAKRLNPSAHVFTSTNGTRLDDQMLQAIVGEELLTEIQFSIDGAKRETFEAIRKLGSYDLVIRNLRRCLAERDRQARGSLLVRTEMLVMRPTSTQVFDFIRQMAELGVQQVFLDSPKGAEFTSLRVDDDAGLERILEQVQEGEAYLARTHTVLEGPFLMELRAWCVASGRKGPLPSWGIDACAGTVDRSAVRTSACGLPWESFSFGANGEVRVCCNSYRPMGRSPVPDMAAIWRQSGSYQDLRTELVSRNFESSCRRCLAENVAEPDRVTPPTYLHACLVDRAGSTRKADLMGRTVDHAAGRPAPDAWAIVEAPEIAAAGGAGPARLVGWLKHDRSAGEGELLAVAVNAVIRGVVQTVPVSPGFDRWSLRLEDGGRIGPAPRLDVLRILRSGEDWQVQALAPPPTSVLLNGAGERCYVGSAPWWDPREAWPRPRPGGPLHGCVEGATIADGVVTLRGWARHRENLVRAERVLLLLHGQPVRAVRPWLERPDVGRAYGGPSGAFGFDLEFPLALAADLLPRQLVVLALDDQGSSVELDWGRQRGVIAHEADAESAETWVTNQLAVELGCGWLLRTAGRPGAPPGPFGGPRRLWPRRSLTLCTEERLQDATRTTFSGWAVDPRRNEPAFAVHAMIGRHCIGRTRVGIWRGQAPAPALRYSGFTLVVPNAALHRRAPEDVELVAVPA